MNKQQVLEQAIQKALTNGWEHSGKLSYITPGCYIEWQYQDQITGLVDTLSEHFREVLFDHDFAKALWGEEPFARTTSPHPDYELSADVDELVYLTNWQYHLQQMVIAEDPIEYLAEHMPEAELDAPAISLQDELNKQAEEKHKAGGPDEREC